MSTNHKESNKLPLPEDFVTEYLEHGFGSMTKSELELLIFERLLSRKAWQDPDNLPSEFDIASDLKVPVSRLRNLKDKLTRKAPPGGEEAKKKLREIITEYEQWHKKDNDSVSIEIEDGYLREFAESLIKKHKGIVDTSFNRKIITMSGHIFLQLVSELIDDGKKNKVLAKFNQIRKKSNNQAFSTWDQFKDKFIEAAADEAGRKSVKLAFATLTGGLSGVSDIIEAVAKRITT